MSDMAEVESGQGSEEMLTVEEREVCRRIATADAPHSQRALALMALDQGVTQAEAAQLSGLTTGQVRYWRDRFREKRLGIFPEVTAAETGGHAKSKAPRAASREPEPVASADAESAPPAKKKPKKNKQGKAAKKKTKGGKGKSVTAEKKSKKKKKAKAKVKKGKKTKGKKGKSTSKDAKKKKKKSKGKK